ncbi:hypothetical protein C9374_009511 [Naegleria lovaniensis]|uniref:FH2 domain-containing protein n=1 Tax=Naegleria lovaniensis TaxID=51637 RepID=A0AA88KRR8_NAELO|nr:uncharacterized protein C9374_009511 [Naegleria lovaniensis]KAG2392934.1 hypothetical protein C9374_009511 [Naegleria lovaniensis]
MFGSKKKESSSKSAPALNPQQQLSLQSNNNNGGGAGSNVSSPLSSSPQISSNSVSASMTALPLNGLSQQSIAALQKEQQDRLQHMLSSMGEDEVNQEFADMLLEMGVPENIRRKQLTTKNVQEKLRRLYHFKYHSTNHGEQDQDTPSILLSAWEKNDYDIMRLARIRELLLDKPIRWVNQFIMQGGIKQLIHCLNSTNILSRKGERDELMLDMENVAALENESDNADAFSDAGGEYSTSHLMSNMSHSNLSVYNQDQTTANNSVDQEVNSPILSNQVATVEDLEKQSLCIEALKALLNTNVGIEEFLAEKDAMKNLVLILDTPNMDAACDILQILTVMASWASHGFSLVVSALSHYRLVKREKARFYDIINRMKTTKNLKYSFFALLLFTTLLEKSPDEGTKSLFKKEFRNLKVAEATAELKKEVLERSIESMNDPDAQQLLYDLNIQIELFDEDVSICQPEFLENDLSDSVNVVKLLKQKLASAEDETLRNMLHELLTEMIIYNSISIDKSQTEQQVADNWSKIRKLVDQGLAPKRAEENTKITTEKEKQLSDRVKTQQFQINNLQSERETLLQEYESKIEQAIKRMEEYEKKISGIEEEKAQYLKEIEEKVSGVKNELTTTEKERDSKQETLKTIKNELVTINNEIETIKNEVFSRKTNNEQFQNAKKILDDKKKHWSQEEERVEKLISSVHEKIEKLKKQEKQLTEERDELKKNPPTVEDPTLAPVMITTTTMTANIPPPPPGMGGGGFVPPPPTGMMGNVPPPPTGMGGDGSVPPPPIGFGNVPPPPGSGMDGSGNIPPPPGMGGHVPPPPLGTDSGFVPPPPGMGNVPPPPGMGNVPPPPGMGGVPPPPGMGGGVPPPPGMGGIPMPPGMGGVPMPPGFVPGVPGVPMMGRGKPAEVLPTLPSKAPKETTRQVHFDAINKNNLSKTIFMKKNIAQETNDIIELFDLDDITSAFSTQKKDTGEKAEPKEKKKEVKSLLDPKRSYAVSLQLGSIRGVSYEQLRKAIVEMDENVVTADNILTIKQIAPEQEECDTVMGYDGPMDELAEPDKFFRVMNGIPNLIGRLDSWSFKFRFPEMVSKIRPDIENMTLGCKEARESEKFMEVLAVILTFGNFLNGQQKRKVSYGFKLKSLQKLADTKSGDGKTSLLQYIVDFIAEKKKHLMDFDTQLTHIQPATRVLVGSIDDDISELKKCHSQLVQQIEKARNNPFEGDMFIDKMEEFEKKVVGALEIIEEKFKAMKVEIDELAKAFDERTEDLQKEPDKFLALIDQFTQQFKQANEKNEQAKKAEEKKKKAEEEKLKKEAAKQQLKINAAKQKLDTLKNKPTLAEGRGAMDDKMQQLKSAAATRLGVTLKRGGVRGGGTDDLEGGNVDSSSLNSALLGLKK